MKRSSFASIAVVVLALASGCGSNAQPEVTANQTQPDLGMDLGMGMDMNPPAGNSAARDQRREPETPQQRQNRLRERAKTDPEGADAEAIDGMSQRELLATAINSAGYLCARVTDYYPSRGDIMVHCREYRNGRGRVTYRVDPVAGTVDPA
jgi:hypothetical protein